MAIIKSQASKVQGDIINPRRDIAIQRQIRDLQDELSRLNGVIVRVRKESTRIQQQAKANGKEIDVVIKALLAE